MPNPLPPPSRLVYLDSLRGVLLVMMAVNHIPSELRVVTDHPFGYVSSAEAFVFLAGVVAGLVYARKQVQGGRRAMERACARRSGEIFLHHGLALLGLFVWVVVFTLARDGELPGNAPTLLDQRPWAALALGAVLLYQPPLFDVLPMYCLFLSLLPGVLTALDHGGRRWVWGASLLLWAFTNVLTPQEPLRAGLVELGAFNLSAWQLVFVTGVICGHAWSRGERLVPRLHPGLLAAALAVALVGYLYRHGFVRPGGFRDSLIWLTNKNNVAPGRLLNVAALLYLVQAVAARYPHLLSWRGPALLGRHGLAVYTVHLGVAYAIYAFPQVFAVSSSGRWLGTGLMVAVMTLVAWQQERLARRRLAADTGSRRVGTGGKEPPTPPAVPPLVAPAG